MPPFQTQTEPKTVRDVNRILHAEGVPEKLVKGKGYYFFFGGTTDAWPTTRVDVQSIEELSVEQWIQKYRQLRAEYQQSLLPNTGTTCKNM